MAPLLVKFTVLVAHVKEAIVQLAPTLINSLEVAVSAPAPDRFAPTVRLFAFSVRVPAVMFRLLDACAALSRLPPLASVRL